jgi:hypothetical protein
MADRIRELSELSIARERILDFYEERRAVGPFKVQRDQDRILIEGDLVKFDQPYSCYGGPHQGGWTEQIAAPAFNRTLNERPDVMLVVHGADGPVPMARTKSMTLGLRVTDGGLTMRTVIETSEDIGTETEIWFRFRVKDHDWTPDYDHRMVREISLHKAEIRVINTLVAIAHPHEPIQIVTSWDIDPVIVPKQLVVPSPPPKPKPKRQLKVVTELPSKMPDPEPEVLPAPKRVPPVHLLRAYAAIGEIPTFELSTKDITGFCVYVLLDSEQQPVYVGQSRQLFGRLSEHLRSEKADYTETVQVLLCPSKAHMVELEARLIQLYQPRFNTIMYDR